MSEADEPSGIVEGPPGAFFHIAEAHVWRSSGSHYRPDSLEGEGFIHLSAAHQVWPTTRRHYAGRTGLVLLVVDPGRLEGAEIHWEPAPHGESFPHLYGPLPVAAVTETRPWPD